MPLPSSGAISLNQMHVEAGGTSGTQASMNDSDIRGLVNAAANSQMTFSSFYGASSSLFSATMTVGSLIIAGGDYAIGSDNYGFNDNTRSGLFSASWGSLSSTSASGFSNSGSTLAHLAHITGSISAVRLVVDDNTTISNSGWTTLTIGSTTFSRTAATFTFSGNAGVGTNNSQGNKGTWQWNTTNNPFGTSGTKSISIT